MRYLTSFLFLLFFVGCNSQEGYKFLKENPVITSPVNCDDENNIISNQFSMAQEDTPTIEICSELQNYQCDSRIFSPEVRDEVIQEEYCLADGNCITITKYLNFTLEDGAESDNDSSCYLKDYLDRNGVYRFRGSNDSIEEAIKTAKLECLKGAIQ